MTGVDDMFDGSLPQSHISGLRECSRRLLSGTLIQYDLPENYEDEFHELLVSLSDLNPALTLTSEEISTSGIDKIIILIDGTPSIQLGGIEPDDIRICWIKENLDKVWPTFKKNCIDLAFAGYPGCEGCIDDDQSEKWSEKLSRTSMKNSS